MQTVLHESLESLPNMETNFMAVLIKMSQGLYIVQSGHQRFECAMKGA